MAIINGEAVAVSGVTLLDYLETEGYRVDTVVVERNLAIVPKDRLSDTVIEPEDTIEILNFVGGG